MRSATGDILLSSCSRFAWAETHVAEMQLDRQDGDVLVLAAAFPAAPSASPVDAMRRGLHPAAAAFFRAWWRGRASRRHALDLVAALDRSGHGWLILDDRQKIAWANRQADRLLDSAHAIRRSAGSIAAATMADTVLLRTAIMQAGSGQGPHPAHEVMRLPDQGGADALTVMISAWRQEEEPDAGRTILTLIDPALDLRPAAIALGQILRLSRAEGEIAAEIVAGSSLVIAAARLGIKLSTARSQLKSVFVKTRVASQADLVRLFLISAPPSMALPD